MLPYHYEAKKRPSAVKDNADNSTPGDAGGDASAFESGSDADKEEGRASPPAVSAKIADFNTALMRSISVECLVPGRNRLSSSQSRRDSVYSVYSLYSVDEAGGPPELANQDSVARDPALAALPGGATMDRGVGDYATTMRKASVFSKLGKVPTEKIINDSIHGTMKIPPAVVAIIDTKQFARLRKLKQVGSCQFTYPNATHTRFEHSLGVGYLAQKFARHLLEKYPDYMDAKDVLCVMLAGICHDLGHGPFSHLWEVFIHAARPNLGYQHEDTSILMFEHLLESNNLRPVLKELADIDERDIVFIKEQIGGILDEKTGLPNGKTIHDYTSWPYKGRGVEKSFLYEIVANKISGIDVDKWDYFLRDDYYMKIGHVFNYERFIFFSRVEKIASTGRKQIIIRDKELENLKSLIEDRARLHMHGYQHRVTKIVDKMLIDAWLIADKYIKFRGTNGRLLCLSETCNDIVAHEKIYDSNINSRIEDSEDPAVAPAKELLDRIDRRDFYEAVYSVDVTKNGPESVRGMTAKQILEEVKEFVWEEEEDEMMMVDDGWNAVRQRAREDRLSKDDLTTFTKKITTGMTTNKIFVYQKDTFNNNVEVCEVPLDGVFENIRKEIVFIVVKRRSVVDQASAAVMRWKEDKGLKA